ncbi:hypothetical protein FVA74_11395 [Salinibacterium sp. dk2585]|uniref:hypothetical protein n=1 Tax=unclassified Salinibacterium TaxID=2632331 RepID=UPI0011C24E80|nr:MULTISPECIES: hypothetical protein [unclassified Salinibacterium]QEE62106.1 hypothetical protein FVA74_11395 [Salinibacterium sp. dk2585]TXK53458.1 hypothetical protein FVP63_09665 [Salinibacterium sp. dk5596]
MKARARARQLQPGSTVRWDRIERDAFAGHPGVVYDAPGPTTSKEKKKMRRRDWFLTVPLFIIVAAAVGSPIWGFVAIAADGSRFATAARDSDPATTIPVAGAFFACALLVLLSLMIAWLVRGRPRAAGFEFGYSVITLILSIMAAFSISRRGEMGGVEGWDLWVLPAVACIIVGGLFAFVLSVIRLRHQAASTLSFENADLLESRTEKAKELSDTERAAIRADLDAAIADLEERGIICATTAERARRAPLGGLSLTLADGATTATP